MPNPNPNHRPLEQREMIDDIIIQLGIKHRSLSPYDVRVALTDGRITKAGLKQILREINTPDNTTATLSGYFKYPMPVIKLDEHVPRSKRKQNRKGF